MAPAQLLVDDVEHAGAALAPHQEHRRRHFAELGARDGRQILPPFGEHFSPQLERVRQQVGTDACWEPIERPAPRPRIEEQPDPGDGISVRKCGARRIETVCIESTPRRIARLGGGQQRKDRRLRQHQRANELGMVPSQLQRRVRSVGRADDVRRSDIEGEQQRREILGMQLGRVRLVVVYLRIGRMIAAAVYEDAIDLRERILLA